MWQRSDVGQTSTSSQRTCTFGPYIPLERQNEYRHQTLVTRNARITGFCFNDKGVLSPEQVRIGVTQEDESLESLESLPIFPFQPTRLPPQFIDTSVVSVFRSNGWSYSHTTIHG